jgi:hypothetical protein
LSKLEELQPHAAVRGILADSLVTVVTAEALAYNGLVQSWPEITRLAREGRMPKSAQA